MWVIGGYIHENPKHVQEGRVIGAATVRDSHPGFFSGRYECCFFLAASPSVEIMIIGIGLAEPRIFQQLGHCAMFVGHLRFERYVSNDYCVSYKLTRNLSAAQTASEGWLAYGRLVLT